MVYDKLQMENYPRLNAWHLACTSDPLLKRAATDTQTFANYLATAITFPPGVKY